MTWEMPRESNNHEPTELCPHPEWWTAYNAVSTENEISKLVAAFVVAMQPEFVVEIGAHYGYTTERIANALIENNHGHLVSLEIDEPLSGSAKAHCAGVVKPEVFDIVVINSLEYIPPRPIDLLFIDGGAETRFADFVHFRPYLSKYPVIIAHDMDYYTVDRDKMIADWEGTYIMLHSPRGLLVMTR